MTGTSCGTGWAAFEAPPGGEEPGYQVTRYQRLAWLIVAQGVAQVVEPHRGVTTGQRRRLPHVEIHPGDLGAS